eukprot:g11911.t1
MGESHAFGASLCCSRRHFILSLCLAMSMVCAARILYWLIQLGAKVPQETQAACTGDECFQIFTCIGMKDATKIAKLASKQREDTTAHIMEPLFTLSGIIFFPLGFHAAHHGDDTPMKRFALFLLATTAVRLGVIAFDVAFMHACEMYDTNMMNFVLNSLLPPSPLRVGVQETWKMVSLVGPPSGWQDKLRGLHLFHLELVNGITGNFNILAWYLILSGLWTALFLYATVEAMSLSSLMQNELLCISEELNRTAIRRKVQSGINSKFMDDAHLPLSQGTHVGRLSNPTYGTQSPPARTYKDFSDYSTGFDGVPYELPDEEEDEAEVVRQLAEKLSQEESPEAMLDRAFVA